MRPQPSFYDDRYSDGRAVIVSTDENFSKSSSLEGFNAIVSRSLSSSKNELECLYRSAVYPESHSQSLTV